MGDHSFIFFIARSARARSSTSHAVPFLALYSLDKSKTRSSKSTSDFVVPVSGMFEQNDLAAFSERNEVLFGLLRMTFCAKMSANLITIFAPLLGRCSNPVRPHQEAQLGSQAQGSG